MIKWKVTGKHIFLRPPPHPTYLWEGYHDELKAQLEGIMARYHLDELIVERTYEQDPEEA